MICIDEEGKVVDQDVYGKKLKRKSSVDVRLNRLIEVTGGAIDFITRNTTDHDFSMALEGYAFSARGNVYDLGEIRGVLLYRLRDMIGALPVEVPVTTARKTVLGNGRASKKEVIPKLKERGFAFKDHNIADAYVVAEHLRIKEKEKWQKHKLLTLRQKANES